MLSEEEITGGAMKATSVSPKMISIFPSTDLMSRECRLIEDVAAHEGLIGCVLPYLAAKDTLRLDTAIGTKDTRAFLKKAYVGLRSPGFDAHVYSDRNNFKGFHWMMDRSVVVQNLKLEYKGEWENQNEVLHKLVIDQNKSMATNLATMSTVKNTEILYKWRSSSTLVEAAKLNYIEVVKQLMERGADVNECNKWRNTPLIEASWHNNPEMVKTLLAYGAEVNRPNFAGVLPIFAAAQAGSLPIVQTLLAAGANVDAKRGCGTPLYTASSGGYVDVIRALLAAGAAINQAANDDCTPLYMAACTGRAHAVKVLLEEGANPSMGDSRGETPLHAAACRGQIEAVRELVDATESAGVNLDLRTQDGKTPLLWASWHEQVEIVQLLLNKGANPLRPDHAGNTPLSVALALEAEADTFEARDLRNQSQGQGQGQDGHDGAGSTPLGYSSAASPSPTYARSPHRLPLITLGNSRLGASTPGMPMPIPSTSSSGSGSSAVGLSPISDLHSNSEEEESEAGLAMSEDSQVRLIARDRYSSYAPVRKERDVLLQKSRDNLMMSMSDDDDDVYNDDDDDDEDEDEDDDGFDDGFGFGSRSADHRVPLVEAMNAEPEPMLDEPFSQQAGIYRTRTNHNSSLAPISGTNRPRAPSHATATAAAAAGATSSNAATTDDDESSLAARRAEIVQLLLNAGATNRPLPGPRQRPSSGSGSGSDTPDARTAAAAGGGAAPVMALPCVGVREGEGESFAGASPADEPELPTPQLQQLQHPNSIHSSPPPPSSPLDHLSRRERLALMVRLIREASASYNA